MDFKSFKNNYAKEDTTKNVKDTINAYQNKSQDELLGEILKLASNGKANGTITDETLSNFAKTMSPMLSNEQREKLNNVLNQIKG